MSEDGVLPPPGGAESGRGLDFPQPKHLNTKESRSSELNLFYEMWFEPHQFETRSLSVGLNQRSGRGGSQRLKYGVGHVGKQHM